MLRRFQITRRDELNKGVLPAGSFFDTQNKYKRKKKKKSNRKTEPATEPRPKLKVLNKLCRARRPPSPKNSSFTSSAKTKADTKMKRGKANRKTMQAFTSAFGFREPFHVLGAFPLFTYFSMHRMSLCALFGL